MAPQSDRFFANIAPIAEYGDVFDQIVGVERDLIFGQRPLDSFVQAFAIGVGDERGPFVDAGEFGERFAGQGAEPYATTPAEFAALLAADVEKWGAVVSASGAKVD